MACFNIPSLTSSWQHPSRAGRGRYGRPVQLDPNARYNYLLHKETDFLRPKYFKLSQTKTHSRNLKLVISLTGDRWDYSLWARPAPPPPKKKKLATSQVGGNTCLTKCGIYISYSLKTSSQGHNLQLTQSHKYIKKGKTENSPTLSHNFCATWSWSLWFT
jgi:hypothetical protein